MKKKKIEVYCPECDVEMKLKTTSPKGVKEFIKGDWNICPVCGNKLEKLEK